jgi:hypothetical protein
VPDKNVKQGMSYQYWLLVLSLLKQGIPYALIEQVTDEELVILLGLTAAMAQTEQDTMEREQRQTQMRGM